MAAFRLGETGGTGRRSQGRGGSGLPPAIFNRLPRASDIVPPYRCDLSVTMSHTILLYDGVCGLCNRLVQFILRRDPAGVFRFASLQSAVAERVLARHGVGARQLETVYVLVDAELPEERLLAQSDAVIFILRQLGRAELRSAGPPRAAVPTQAKATPTPTTGTTVWRVGAVLLNMTPRVIRDWGYGMIARNRYRMFGRYDTCPMPSEETRDRFLG